MRIRLELTRIRIIPSRLVSFGISQSITLVNKYLKEKVNLKGIFILDVRTGSGPNLYCDTDLGPFSLQIRIRIQTKHLDHAGSGSTTLVRRLCCRIYLEIWFLIKDCAPISCVLRFFLMRLQMHGTFHRCARERIE